MKRFEYKRVCVPAVTREGQSNQQLIEETLEYLNDLGNEGWQGWTAVRSNDGAWVVIFLLREVV